jgi:ABC-2 type transport system permease protein
MWERIKEIIRKEFFQTVRDSRSRALLLGPPLLQLIIFGYAVNMDVERTNIAWMDMDRTYESRALLSSFQGSKYFAVQEVLAREDEIAEALDLPVGTVKSRVYRAIRALRKELARLGIRP